MQFSHHYLLLGQGAFSSGDWRNEPSTSDLTDVGYTGHRHNNTATNDLGLIYMNARYYLPGTGRFVSADTLIPDPVNSQSYNRFSYVFNNPLGFIDPTGFWTCAAEGDDLTRCQEWVEDLLAMLRDDGGAVAYGLYLWFIEYDASLGGDGMVFEIMDGNIFGATMETRGSTIKIDRNYVTIQVSFRP